MRIHVGMSEADILRFGRRHMGATTDRITGRKRRTCFTHR